MNAKRTGCFDPQAPRHEGDIRGEPVYPILRAHRGYRDKGAPRSAPIERSTPGVSCSFQRVHPPHVKVNVPRLPHFLVCLTSSARRRLVDDPPQR